MMGRERLFLWMTAPEELPPMEKQELRAFLNSL